MLISPDSIFRTSLHPTQIQQTKAHLTLAFQNSTHPTHLTQFWHSSKVLKQFDCFLPSFMVMNVSIDKFWRFPGTFLLLQAEDCRAWRIFYGSITLLSSLSKRSRVHVYSHDSYKLLYYERSKKKDFFCAIFFRIILGQQKLHTFWKKILILKTVQGVQTSFEVKKYRQNDEFSHFPGTDQYSKAHKS